MKLNWQQLSIITDNCEQLFSSANASVDFFALQQRLSSTLSLFCQQPHSKDFAQLMLINANESKTYLSLITKLVKIHRPQTQTIYGANYLINGQKVTLSPAKTTQDNFAATDYCLSSEWLESEQLFGFIRQYNELYTLHPGLIHNANGGVLILSLRTLLNQPILWYRLKNIINNKQHQWFSLDETKSLPFFIPPIDINLKLILIGDDLSLSDFQLLEPELYQQALFCEFETVLNINSDQGIIDWFAYLKAMEKIFPFPPIDVSAVERLLKIGTRKTEDQTALPLCPEWLTSLFNEAIYFGDQQINHTTLTKAIQHKIWRESYLVENTAKAIHQGQINIQTDGMVIGQVNGLSVLEYPGHPLTFGEPSRISCVLQQGNGEINDVEHRNELGGNIHAKSVMIIQAFIANELALEQQLPFTASLVFEQSYSEIEGDSASLASLCAYISALSLTSIDQQIAVTGSVDQFGNIQAVGGINEKIEGFFRLCQRRNLTQKQGVIIPTSNILNLSLAEEVIDAVKNEQFHIWAINHAYQAFELLMQLPYKHPILPSLLTLIQKRIQHTLDAEKKYKFNLLKWLAKSNK